jgi:uncharacterized membrane protein
VPLDLSRVVRFLAIAIGAIIAFLGVWAFFSPQSFYDQLATFPPYNRHLLHDVGAFQIGIGIGLVLAVRSKDALLLGLQVGAIAAVVHAISHIIDRNLGGRTTDPWSLSLLALVLVAAAVLRRRELRPRAERRREVVETD